MTVTIKKDTESIVLRSRVEIKDPSKIEEYTSLIVEDMIQQIKPYIKVWETAGRAIDDPGDLSKLERNLHAAITIIPHK